MGSKIQGQGLVESHGKNAAKQTRKLGRAVFEQGPGIELLPRLDGGDEGYKEHMEVGGVLGIARPEITLKSLKALEYEQCLMRKAILLEDIPYLIFEHVVFHFDFGCSPSSCGLQPMFLRKLGEFILAFQIGDGGPRSNIFFGFGGSRIAFQSLGGRHGFDATTREM